MTPPVRKSEAVAPTIALVVAVLGSSMAFLDGTVVNVALPVIQRELAASITVAQWIVESYALLLASLVLVGGALGDHLGRRRVFLAGVALFAIASAGCGLSRNAAALVVTRGIQGVGAALLVPGSLALIRACYTNDDERSVAIGTWSAASAVTAAVGPVAGGWVIAHASWRWLFFFNVPIALLTILLGARVRESRDATSPATIDWLGAILATTGLGLVVFALIESEHAGWTTALVASGAIGAIFLVLFVVAEARQRAPMLPLSLFRSHTFAGTNVVTLLLYAALGGGLFFVPFDLIQAQGYSPTEAGASFLPFIIILSTMSRWAGKLATRWGVRRLLMLGPAIAATGFALLAIPSIGGTYWTTFFPGVVVLGIGMGFTVAPLTAAVMGSVDSEHAGVASGINNAMSRAAGLLAVAALGALLLARFHRVLDTRLAELPSLLARIGREQSDKMLAADFSSLDPASRFAIDSAFRAAYAAAFRTLMITCAALAALASLSAAVIIDTRKRSSH
jgi:EmrB/QacA subfamily drug resistance transporter